MAVNHATDAVYGHASQQAVAYWNEHGTPPITLRSPRAIAAFFDGLEVLPPGVVSCSRWRPELSRLAGPAEVDEFCGLARKPLAALARS